MTKSSSSLSSTIIVTGALGHRALLAAKELESKGIAVTVVNVHTIKPLDTEALLRYAPDAPLVLTVEEGVLNGGLGSAVAECFADNGVMVPQVRLGIPDVFATHYGTQDDLMETYGLTAENIAATVRQKIGAAHDRRAIA